MNLDRIERGNTRIYDVYIAYQPIIDLNTQNIFAYEALLRDFNGTPPYIIFNEAKKKDCLTSVDMACIENSIQNLPFDNCKLFINIFPDTLPALANTINDFLTAKPGGEIIIEVIEFSKIDFNNGFKETVHYLKNQGVKFAVDDISSGYNRLQLIVELKPDFIKIDRPLIRTIKERDTLVIVKHLIEIAKDLGKNVVAEGIETIEELMLVRNLGIHLAQGYYFEYPKTPEQLKLEVGISSI